MKKLAYIILAASAATALSCTKEMETPAGAGDVGMVTFTATAGQTRTELSDGHTVWSEDDRITVFYGENSAVAILKTGENTPNATFEAAVPESAEYFAIYPASRVSGKQGDKYLVSVPKVQDGCFGSAHIAAAKGKDKAFSFTNLNAFLKIILPEPGITSIVVESPGSGALSGNLNVTFMPDGTPVTSEVIDGTPSVEIASLSPSGFPAGEVFISVPCDSHPAGLLLSGQTPFV